MICNKCNDEGILNSALGQEFYYCRTCKEEIQLEVVKVDTAAINQSGEVLQVNGNTAPTVFYSSMNGTVIAGPNTPNVTIPVFIPDYKDPSAYRGFWKENLNLSASVVNYVHVVK